MRVLIANKFFFRNGGSEVVMFQERAFLKNIGVDVIDFSMKDDRNSESPYAEYFVEHRSYEGGRNPLTGLQLIHSPEAVRKMRALIADTRPDLVHCHNVYHQLTPSIIGAAADRGVPVVLTLHDYKPICPTYTRLRGFTVCSECAVHGPGRVLVHRCAGGSLLKSALLYAEAVVQRRLRSYEKLAAVIAPSEFMRDSVVGARFPKDRVHLVRNGIDVKTIRVADRDDGYLLYLGRLSREKGIETLLEAHAALADEVPLLIAGTGPLEEELRSRFPRARFLGHVTGTRLEDVMSRAAAVIVPSSWYENAPMSVLEAMAHGKPVVAANIGGLPEMVRHEESGLLFPPGDRDSLRECLSRLMSDVGLRRKFGVRARELAETSFSLERHNELLLQLYHDVIGRGRSPSAPRAGTGSGSSKSWT